MATNSGNRTVRPARYPLATEFGLIVLVVVGLSLVQSAVSRAAWQVFDVLQFSGSLLTHGLLNSSVILAGSVLLAGAYARRRRIAVGLALPTTSDFPTVASAALLPAALVGLTKLVGSLTGTRYGELTQTMYAPNPALEPVLAVTGLSVFVGVPSLLLVCQVVVQGGFERVVGGEAAIGLTTVFAGYLLVESDGGGLSPFPDRGRLVGAVLFCLAVALALYATERADRRWVRKFSYLPAMLFVALTVVSGLLGIESVAGGLFVVVQVAVLGLAAYTYQRTDSLLSPALAYLSLLVSSDAVVLLFEAGMTST